jgi:hypothetical protein
MLLESTVTLQILVLKPCESLSEKDIIYAQYPILLRFIIHRNLKSVIL